MIAVNVWMGSVLLCTVALFLIMRVALLLGNTALYQSSQHKKMRFLLLLELHTPQDIRKRHFKLKQIIRKARKAGNFSPLSLEK